MLILLYLKCQDVFAGVKKIRFHHNKLKSNLLILFYLLINHFSDMIDIQKLHIYNVYNLIVWTYAYTHDAIITIKVLNIFTTPKFCLCSCKCVCVCVCVCVFVLW